MTVEELEKLEKKEIIEYIRTKKPDSFEMSGYDIKTGDCTIKNQSILNTFADLGIYDYTSYLFLDFYKGTPTFYYKYFFEDENYVIEDEWSGYTTSEIIYEIFKLTIFSKKRKRRRDW